MEILLEKQDRAYGLVTVKVGEQDYMPEFNKALKNYGKNVQLKGFRPGKVPPALIRKMYGKEVIQDVFNKAVSRSLDQYLKDNQVRTLFYPLYKGDFVTPEQLESQTEHDLLFEVMLEPEFEYALDHSMTVKLYHVTPSAEDISSEIEALQKKYPKTASVETVEEGAFLHGTFSAADGSFEQKSVLPLSRIKEAARATFIGKKAGETVTFDLAATLEPASVKLLFGLSEEEAAAKSGTYSLSLDEITLEQPSPLDQDFFDRLLGKETVSTEEEFRAKLSEMLEKGGNEAADRKFHNDLKKALLEHLQFDLDNDLLKKYYEAGMANQENQQPLSEADKAHQLIHFKEDARWDIILNRLGRDLEIKVTTEEVLQTAREKISEQFAQIGFPVDPEQLEGYVNNFLSYENGKNFRELHNEIFVYNVLDVVAERIKVEKQEIGYKDILDILQHDADHAHDH